MRRVIFVGLMLSSVLAAGPGCNRRVFQEVLPTCDGTIADATDIAAEKAADILIVVDNSGSMQEEQDRLAAAFINDNPAQCPIPSSALKDFARCGDAEPPAVCRYSNPSQELLETPGPDGLSQCGFIQVIAAFENDFRLGVITTDVGACDNRLPAAQAELCGADGLCFDGSPCGGAVTCPETWGFHPQRGCLQPDGPLGATRKIISRQDLLDEDPTNDDIGQRFSETLANIRTFGSAVERGLDAVDLFLDPATPRDERCANDLGDFIRDDAKLVVIFLTDEEDCSRSSDVSACGEDGCDACDNEEGCEIFECPINTSCEPGMTEFVNETCGENRAHVFLNAGVCYGLEANLTPVQHYVDRLKAKKSNPDDVSVAVIAGGLIDADKNVFAAGCSFNEGDGQPVGGCIEKQGRSNECGPDDNCCFADPGGRYYDFATALGTDNGLKDTICVDSFSQTMIKIAVFIADVDSLTLAEEPEDDSLIVVEKAPQGSDDFVVVPRANGTSCEGAGDGWVLEADGLKVRFCGSERPLAGERIRVSAKGKGANGEGPDACEERGVVRDPAN